MDDVLESILSMHVYATILEMYSLLVYSISVYLAFAYTDS